MYKLRHPILTSLSFPDNDTSTFVNIDKGSLNSRRVRAHAILNGVASLELRSIDTATQCITAHGVLNFHFESTFQHKHCPSAI